MAFSHRIATLAAVVAIPLGIAVTSYALTDSPDKAEPPAKVELESESPSAGPSGSGDQPSSTPGDDETVPRPPATDDSNDDGPDDDASTPSDSPGKSKGDGDDDGPGDDGAGDDGPGDDG